METLRFAILYLKQVICQLAAEGESIGLELLKMQSSPIDDYNTTRYMYILMLTCQSTFNLDFDYCIYMNI